MFRLEVAEIAEDCTLLGEAFQKIVSDLLWRRCGTGPGGGVLRNAENRGGPKEKCFSCKSAAVPAPERHVSFKSKVPCGLET